MVSAAVAPPVVKSVDDTGASHAAANRARVSVTVTVPSAAVTDPDGAAAPSAADTGAVINSGPLGTTNVVSVPDVTGNVTMVSACAAVAAAATASAAAARPATI